jgi:replicative DNA helicase
MNIKKQLTEKETLALATFVHTPAETASGFVRYAEEIHAHPGVTFGCVLDRFVIPIRPGRALGLMGRPGSGKTVIGAAFIKREAKRIADSGLQDKYYAAHISWEQSVEELDAMYQDMDGFDISDVSWGRVPIDNVIQASIKRPNIPVWMFGDSLYKTNFDTPPMTVEAVYDSIGAIQKAWGLMPSLLFFDYIQDIPVPSERDRYMQVSSAMRLVKRLGIQAKCPVIIGIQANQRVDDKKNPIPGMRDGEWSAVIGQKLDTLLALWRPIRTYLPHEEPTINVGGSDYDNTDELLVFKLLKQRGEKGTGIWAVRFDPATLTLSDYVTYDLNPAPIDL